MEKLDLTKKYKSYYTAKSKPELIIIPGAQYLSILGKGDPSCVGFGEKLQALYSVAYTLKFACKATGHDFTVAKLEGQWWFCEERFANVSISEAPVKVPRSEWQYRLLLRIPDFVRATNVEDAINAAMAKKKIPLINDVHFFEMTEGKCVQMLHVGPFDAEPKTLLHMHDFMQEYKLGKNGLHHEIYLSDFRKTPGAKQKTILREPVK